MRKVYSAHHQPAALTERPAENKVLRLSLLVPAEQRI